MCVCVCLLRSYIVCVFAIFFFMSVVLAQYVVCVCIVGALLAIA